MPQSALPDLQPSQLGAHLGSANRLDREPPVQLHQVQERQPRLRRLTKLPEYGGGEGDHRSNYWLHLPTHGDLQRAHGAFSVVHDRIHQRGRGLQPGKQVLSGGADLHGLHRQPAHQRLCHLYRPDRTLGPRLRPTHHRSQQPHRQDLELGRFHRLLDSDLGAGCGLAVAVPRPRRPRYYSGRVPSGR